jgi:hypothetical protein
MPAFAFCAAHAVMSDDKQYHRRSKRADACDKDIAAESSPPHSGRTALRLSYLRPFERDKPPERRFEVTVVVW